MQQVEVTINALLQWKAWQAKSKRWIGVCEPINLSVEADSLDELHSVIGEAIHILMVDLLVDNELDQFLRQRGWSVRGDVPPVQNIDDVEFHVPWEVLVAGNGRDSERRTH